MQRIKEMQATYPATTGFDGVVTEALRQPPSQKVRLAEQLMSVLEKELVSDDLIADSPVQRRSLFGVLSHRGDAPSAEEIDEMRNEAWANSPVQAIRSLKQLHFIWLPLISRNNKIHSSSLTTI